MRHSNRRTAPGVRNGQVQKKNRTATTPNYLTTPMPSLVFDRRRPGAGYRHVVRIPDVRRFVELIPQWDELQVGLNAIVLDEGSERWMGWYSRGVVAICAWKVERTEDCSDSFFKEHVRIFDKLSIPHETDELGFSKVRFTEESARAFLLTHVLVHELGHHYDLMTSKNRRRFGRGEKFAEGYARQHEDKIIDAYRREFQY